jgi:phosphoglycolate phosphatase
VIDRLPACILFDLDGTLVDSLPGIEFSVREAFHSCNLPAPKQSLRGLVGPPIRSILSRAGNVRGEDTLDSLERAFRRSYDQEGWRRSACFPDAARVLRMLGERRHRLFIVSNKPRHASLQILDGQHILDCFEAIVTRDSRSPAYPGKAEMIAALRVERSIRDEDCLMVGDTSEDAGAAASAGIRFIWMTHGYGDTGPISCHPVAYKLDSFSQFLPLMSQGACS